MPGVSGDVVLVLPQIQLFLRLDFLSEMLPGLWGNRVERGIGDRTENRVKIREKVVSCRLCRTDNWGNTGSIL